MCTELNPEDYVLHQLCQTNNNRTNEDGWTSTIESKQKKE